MVPLTLVGIAIAIGAMYYHFTITFNCWTDQHVRGPKPIPIFGNTLKLVLGYKSMGEIFRTIYEKYPSEKVVGFFRMRTPCLLIRDLEIVKHVLIKDFNVFVDRGIAFSKNGLGTNLFHSDGETWRALRHRFAPMFSNLKLRNMMYLLNERANKFIEYVSDVTTDSPVLDVHGLVRKYTMSTIWACAFGLDIDTFRGEIHATLKKIDQTIFSPSFIVEFEMMYPGLPKKLKMDLFPGYMTDFFKDLVKKVMTQRNGVPSTRNDFMDLLIEIKNNQSANQLSKEEGKTVQITDSIIEAQAFAFYVAGYETSASTIGFMLYQLALNPEIQTKLTIEVDDYLRRHNGRIEVDTLKELTYMEQVLNETLRMYPIVEHFRRKAQTDYECPGTSVKVTKGQQVIVSVWGIHHNKLYYPEPEQFNPDNFSPANVVRRHPCAYMPFGIGPRHCVGMRFAEVQSRVCVVKLLSKFRLVAGDSTARSFNYAPRRIPLTPDRPLYVSFYPREVA